MIKQGLEVVLRISCILCLSILIISCNNQKEEKGRVAVLSQKVEVEDEIITGAQNVSDYYPMIADRRVGLVVNQTSVISGQHLVDSLLKMNVDIKMIFAPEHGFRGEADAGETIKDSKDSKTGIPVVSLYGKKKKPLPEDLKDIDVLLFDIQDVGARFYTYISSLHYVMEACAENDISIIVLDRPNPNAHYIDGPILEKEHASFVGMHPVPVVYGMTIGEYAKMINGEKWLKNGLQANLTVITNRNYDHSMYYNLPIKPSPNLPNIESILLYPSLCLLEGTTVSVGRGTDTQFQVIGHPKLKGQFSFTPKSGPGAKYPKHENITCYGRDLTNRTKTMLHEEARLNLIYVLRMYKTLTKKGEPFFLENNFFEKLAGTSLLREQIVSGLNEEEIRRTWKSGLDEFKKTRAKYLLYE